MQQSNDEHDRQRFDDFVESFVPVVRPCVLISCAVGLVLLVGPQSAEDVHASIVADSHHGGRAAHAVVAHTKRANCTKKVNALSCSPARRQSKTPLCAPCAETERVVHRLDAGPAKALRAPASRSNRTLLPCPGLIGALGSHTGWHAAGRAAGRHVTRMRSVAGSGYASPADSSPNWLKTCSPGLGSPSAWGSAREGGRTAARAPMVYVYDFMDEVHSELLVAPSSRTFFDAWHEHNQFLSEYAFHRSLLASPLLTSDPEAASFFFVPVYARIALANRRLQRKVLKRLRAGLAASAYWQRSAGRDHVFVVSSSRPMAQLYREALPLVSPSILLKVELGDSRRPTSQRQPNHVALPYYVPWLPRDDAARLPDKRFSVCMEATVAGGGRHLAPRTSGASSATRKAVVDSLRNYPAAAVRVVDPRRLSRSLLCASRRASPGKSLLDTLYLPCMPQPAARSPPPLNVYAGAGRALTALAPPPPSSPPRW